MKTEEMKTAQEELNTLFATLQRIEAPMTENNVAVMNACLGSVKFIFNMLEKAKKGVTENGNIDAE